MTAPSWISEPDVEVLDLRHFASADLRPVLDEESRLWSELLHWDYLGSRDMILRYIESKILPGYAALQQGEVIGYCFFVYEGNKGVIGDLFVRDLGRAGVVRLQDELVTQSISTLQQSPGVHRVEAQLLLHETGQVATPFARCGFQRHPRLFMMKTLDAQSNWRLSPPSDIEVRHWTEHDYQPAASLITACYRGHVDAEINDQYRTAAGSMRFLNNIVRFPGCGQFDGSASFVAVHRSTRALVGLVLCSRVRHDVGHVTQVCVLPDQRGRRIGEALLTATASDLSHRGLSAVSLTVTEANKAAVSLYKHLGYRIHRVFDAFVWEG